MWVPVLKKDPVALVSIGINIISAALCVPTQFPIRATFYRAVILYVVNIFITEIPKWGKSSRRKPLLDKLQVVLFLLGFVLIAIGFVNIATPYSLDSLPQEITLWIWCYFGLSLLMLFISIISNLDVAKTNQATGSTPPVSSLDPTE